MRPLPQLVRDRLTGPHAGITSVCTAHPLAIEAALVEGRNAGTRVLIEATCNQVNQEGGYTGMTPAAFRRFVEGIAASVGFDADNLVLGGDHLGPNPWKHLAAAEAMQRAEAMIDAYAQAGFTKLHLDTSMGCASEAVALPDDITAGRAARLAAVAEAAADGGSQPIYVIGTEVPVPGGALEGLEHLEITTPEAAWRTVDIHRRAFADAGAERAFDRAIGVVVQPGVEFGHADVAAYRPDLAAALRRTLTALSQFVFEAHSTDYQSAPALARLVDDGFAILKVGPWLTFALREALYGLDAIATELRGPSGVDSLPASMERLMLAHPEHWRSHYHGEPSELRLQRHYSYSDRIRYYWPRPEAQAAVDRVLARLEGVTIPPTLVGQFLGSLYPAVASGEVEARPRPLLIAAVGRVLRIYADACRGR